MLTQQLTSLSWAVYLQLYFIIYITCMHIYIITNYFEFLVFLQNGKTTMTHGR